MLVDGGPPDTWPLLERRLRQLDAEDHIDVAVVSHVDSDHIGGMIPLLASDLAPRIRDFWFNGRSHLPGSTRSRSIAQGESLAEALAGSAGTRPVAWNKAFDGGPVDTGDEGFVEVSVRGGPRITVVSPTTERLGALAPKWQAEVEKARRRRREVSAPDEPGSLTDLESLAAERSDPDGSVPNGASIALLVEHRGASALLAADAFASVLLQGLTSLAAARGAESLAVDAFKLPHHGSQANITTALVALAPAAHYLVSSNGDIFHHPDDPALARVVLGAPEGATLWFNYRNARTERWDEPRLRRTHGYAVRYPGEADTGLVLELPSR
jgi:hypothetical protein